MLLLGLYTLWTFLSALVWAAIFAIALWPLYGLAVLRFGTGRHNVLLPAVFTLAVVLIFILPIGLVGLQIAQESHGITEWVRTTQQTGIDEPAFLHSLPFGQAQVVDWWQDNLADPGGVRELVERVTQGRIVNVSRLIERQVARRLTLFVFTLLTLFFLFKEGPVPTRSCAGRRRAFGLRGEPVGQQIIASIHGTVNGLVLVVSAKVCCSAWSMLFPECRTWPSAP